MRNLIENSRLKTCPKRKDNMENRPTDRVYTDVAEYEKHAVKEQHHRGKSSESLLDKEAILDALRIEPGQKVIDAGCGNGYMSKDFSQQVGKTGIVYALDPDEISIAALRAETTGTNIIAMVGDITVKTSLPESTFNLIYLSTVVHCFAPNQFSGFEKEVKRLLAPGGRLAIVEIVKRATPFGPPLSRRLSDEDLKGAVSLTPMATIDVGEFFYMQIFESKRNSG